MKVAGLEITRKKGNKKPDSGSTVSKALNVSNFGAFYKDVEHLHNNGGGDVTILKLKTPSSNPKRIDEVDISAVMEEEDFLQFVLDKYKASIYKFQLWDSSKDLHSEHHFTLGEPKDKKGKGGKKKGKGGKSGKGSKTFQEELTLLVMEKAFDKQTSDAEQWQRTLELAKALKGDNGITPQDMMNFGLQIAGMMQQGQGGSTLEEVLTAVEILQRLQPQQQEEGWAQLVPLLAQLRGGGGASPQLLQEIQTLKQQLQSLAPAAATPTVAGGHPPAPGASASPGGGLGGAVESAASPTPPARVGTEAYFNERYLNPFRRDVAAGEGDDELAYQIVSMTIYARDRMAENLPPIVADFVNATTMPEYNAALQQFFASIPELANLTQKQIGIRTALIMNYMAGFVESPEGEAEEVEEVHDSDAIIHIDQEQVVEEASIHDADRGLIHEAETEAGAGDQDLGASAPDSAELQHEALPSEVG